MVRKDVKLGFIIGGVLLAVLVVYVLVASGDNKKKGVQLTKEDSSAVAPTDAKSEIASRDSTQIEPPTAPETPNAEKQAAESTKVADAKPNDPFGPSGKEDDRWLMALNHGQMPTLMSATTTPPAQTTSAEATAPKQEPVQVSPTTKPSDEVAEKTTPPAVDPLTIEPKKEQPTEQTASNGKMNTHVVQKGETLSKISEVAYGSAAYWPHILRANPGLIDKKLRPGMTINMPEASAVKAEGTPAGVASNGGAGASGSPSPATQPSLDSKTEYRVVTGDSLQKISAKLYGKADQWEKIYDANKDKIGADPAKLKLNTVLKLPSPPTVH